MDGRGGKRRSEKRAWEGVHIPQSEKNDPPSSDGWVRACELQIFRGTRPTSGGYSSESPPWHRHCSPREYFVSKHLLQVNIFSWIQL